MKRLAVTVFSMGLATLALLAFTLQPAWADPPADKHDRDGYGKEGFGGHGMGMSMMMHGSTSHLIRHLLRHQKDIGLTDEQVGKLKELQLNLDKTRIKSEADIQIAERELRALVEDDKSDLGAIEAKLKQSEELQTGLRLAAIKARREALGLLTPEQREKQKGIHEKMMREHKSAGRGHGNPKGEPKKDDGKTN